MTNIGHIRVPKTASTWLTTQLSSYERSTGTTVCGQNHQTASELAVHNHDHALVTMIRNPMQAAISFYMMGQRMKAMEKKRAASGVGETPPMLKGTGPLAAQPHNAATMALINDDTVTVEDYLALCPANQLFGFYYDTISPRDYEYVGNSEEFDKSYFVFSSMYAYPPVLSSDWNTNPEKAPTDPYIVNYSETDFQNRNQLDYEMYALALERFNELCGKYGV